MLTEKDFYAREYARIYADSVAHAPGQLSFIERHCTAPAPMTVLDVGCGFGRHSLLLAAKGHRVLGLDLCRELVAEGNRRAQPLPPDRRPLFVVADMRRLPARTAAFDLALLLFATLAQVPWADQSQVLSAIHRALRPGGWLVLDVLSREWYVRRARSQSTWETENAAEVIDRLESINGDTVRIIRMVQAAGQQRVYHLTQRLYTPQRLAKMLDGAGFSRVRIYADWTDRPPDADTCYLVAVAQAPQQTGS